MTLLLLDLARKTIFTILTLSPEVVTESPYVELEGDLEVEAGDTAKFKCRVIFEADDLFRVVRFEKGKGYWYHQWKDLQWAYKCNGPLADGRTTFLAKELARDIVELFMELKQATSCDSGEIYCRSIATSPDMPESDRKPSDNKNTVKSLHFVVKVKPESPRILSLLPMSVTTDLAIMESEELQMTCSAMAGRKNKGWIEWRIAHSNRLETLKSNDPRINCSTDEEKAQQFQKEAVCLEIIKCKLRFMGYPKDNDLEVSCFIVNEDYQVKAPEYCQDVTKDLCATTGSLQIYRPVTEERLSLNTDTGQTSAEEGQTLRLVCLARVFPAAKYKWIKMGELFRALTVEQVGEESHLVIQKFKAKSDSGTYRCEAQNQMGAVKFNAFKTIFINATTEIRFASDPTPEGPPKNEQKGESDRSTNEEKNSLDSTVPIVFLVVGIAVLLAACCCLANLLYRKRKAQPPPETTTELPEPDGIKSEEPNESMQITYEDASVTEYSSQLSELKTVSLASQINMQTHKIHDFNYEEK